MEKRVAVVTGSAQGIGKAIGLKLASVGINVAVLDLNEEQGNKTCEEIKVLGADAIFIKADVTDYDSLSKSKDIVMEKFGRVDIIVINAGISIKHKIEDISVSEWDKVIAINLNGSFYTLKAYYDELLKKTPDDEAKVIFISSGSAITGTGGGAHYAASKSAQNGLMRAVAKELGPIGINVNAIAPRTIYSELFDHLYPTQESRDVLLKQIPIARIGYPEDVANMVKFLVSKEASYVHSQILLVDGGRTY